MINYTAWGIDYAYGDGLTTAEMKANGVQFVCRYLSDPGNPKNIDKTELDNLLGAGIAVVLNWESTGQMPSEAQGVADAQAAQTEAAGLGLGDAVIYFSGGALFQKVRNPAHGWSDWINLGGSVRPL